MKKWSRRKFLRAGVVSSIAIQGSRAVGLSLMPEDGKAQPVKPAAGGLAKRDLALLRVAMDEIIPAGEGMPSASEAGGVEYLDQLAVHYKKVAREIRESLASLEGVSQERFKSSLLSLSHEQRVELLKALEKNDARTFKILRGYVYEAYYTRPAIWKLMGYEFHPTNDMGPHMKPFDEAALAEVRKKPKYYREV